MSVVLRGARGARERVAWSRVRVIGWVLWFPDVLIPMFPVASWIF